MQQVGPKPGSLKCRLVLAKREAKAETEADTEMLDYWYDLENDFELLSFKAWNKTIIQVFYPR